jgi:hypothetical protein
MSKKWGYFITIEDVEYWLDEELRTNEGFEAEGISPYKILGKDSLTTRMSEFHDGNSNAMNMQMFISDIGDKHTLSFKKLTDSATFILLNAYTNGGSFDEVQLSVVPLSRIPSKARGLARSIAMRGLAMTTITLQEASVTFLMANVQEKNKPDYDYVTLECQGVSQWFPREE